MSDAGLQQVYDALGDPQETRPDGQQIPALQHHIQVTFVRREARPPALRRRSSRRHCARTT